MVQTTFNATGSTVPDDKLDSFVASICGNVLREGDAGYDDSRRIFNGMIDRRPGLIVQPANANDVSATVRFAREHNLLVSVKGGGHAASGHAVCDGGLMIDLALLNEISVDPSARTATAGGGAHWGELDAATQAHGLAVTGGRVPSTGIGGLTLGSGSGWLERKLGYTVDNMIGAEVVLANGDIVQANAQENPDLFWGLRGGGGNFGIVTKFHYRLHEIGPMVFGGMLVFPRFRAAEVIKAYRDFMDSADDDIGGGAVLVCAPPEDFVPEAMHGMPIAAIIVCYAGDPEKGPEAIKPLLDLQPVMNMTQPMPYLEVQKLIEGGNQPGFQNYWKADMFADLPDEAIDLAVQVTDEPPSTLSTIIFQPQGGAAARVPDGETALGWRGAKWSLHYLGAWTDPAEDEKQIAWIRSIAEALQPWAQAGTYLNYLSDDDGDRVKDSFGQHYGRMVELKNKYDPTNFFRLNQNIQPTT
jgi:FAD/FMN-containing dehydrogenase